jgi:hypothetical protein
LAPALGVAVAASEAALGGRPGFFFTTTSVVSAVAAFLGSTADGLAGDLDAGTILTFGSGLLVTLEVTTLTTFLGTVDRTACLAATLLADFAAG